MTELAEFLLAHIGMTELLKLALGALASAAVVAAILTSLLSRLSRPGKSTGSEPGR